MNAPNLLFKALQEASKIAFKAGGKEVLKEFAPHAGRLLNKRDASVMTTYNAVRRALDKM